MQKRLVESEKKIAVKATICSLNHEINNPLQIISGYMELMQHSDCSDDSCHKKIALINEQINRISQVLVKLRAIENPVFEKYLTNGKYDIMLKMPDS
jgi:nitrogen-specific signal transduction histidine kinase